MPKAPRDKESAAPKKRTRKATTTEKVAADNGNGNGAVAAPITVSTEIVERVPEIRVMTNLEDEIRARAYELYLQRGSNGGSPEQDWLRAVEEVCGRQRTA
jgi:hypothetical protein